MKTSGLSRVSKDSIIKSIEKELKAQPVFFVTQHDRVPAASMDKLRSKLRTSKSRYFSIKNSLGKRALEKAKLSQFSEFLTGSSGLVFTAGDPVQSSKTLVEFAKTNEGFKYLQAYLNGEVVGPEKIMTLASLPSREVLLARVLGGMQAPISRFVGVLSGTVRKVVNVLDAIAKKKGSV